MRGKSVLSAFPAALLAFSLASCSDLGPLVRPKPQAELSALTLDFGTVALNQTSSRSLVIRNVGTGPLDVSPSVSGAGYSLPAGNAPFSVPPGGEWTIDVHDFDRQCLAWPMKDGALHRVLILGRRCR